MRSKNTTAARQRRDRLIREREHDSYKVRAKSAEPLVCKECAVVYHRGRWHWGAPPPGAEATVCPACKRMQDRCPAGYLTLGGGFLREHETEILNLARNVEAKEKALHPMKRIMAVEREGEELLITTTEMDMARAIGEAIHHAYQGELHYEYSDESSLLYVKWTR